MGNVKRLRSDGLKSQYKRCMKGVDGRKSKCIINNIYLQDLIGAASAAINQYNSNRNYQSTITVQFGIIVDIDNSNYQQLLLISAINC